MEVGGCVYIMTNFTNTTLYVGVTADIRNRAWEHKNKWYPNSFTSKYKCFKLVYYRFYPSIEEAINEEKRIKGGSRKKKISLIEALNPEWSDLYEGLA